MKLPGFMETHSVRLKSAECQLMLNIKPSHKHALELIVYGQYGEFPTKTSYDFRLTMKSKASGELSTQLSLFNETVNKNKTFDSDFFNDANNTQRINITQIDENTLVLWGFDKHFNVVLNKTILHLSFVYYGEMPPFLIENNPYTFDEIEREGSFNYSLRTFCAECSYWSENDNLWKSDGCEVRNKISCNLTFTVTDLVVTEVV